ncbi:uncharacterized protein K452DRAFT_290187 [Aplosporella prunicola CBS 121167]|uniref:Uncharacterized protein n=1 Tax=Aplosporella prunicola CBS 121167 TaxID=1176127 RepID=A0A6A6B6Q7_9PEZI|nr:uncharacterized protein K452DRAFT_290187 [Aplosporella prunicola CBS 121167]KAF2139083.1 hypothetical protein K452DRAFT_290187 [Aplosporella prunicola CBS 121167]
MASSCLLHSHKPHRRPRINNPMKSSKKPIGPRLSLITPTYPPHSPPRAQNAMRIPGGWC